MAHRIVGQPLGKLEGIGKVSGQARYSGDVTVPGLIWGKALRSPLPHARIIRIDTTRARALAGVLTVLTARDLPDILVGRRMFDMPMLARDRVRFVGEKVAVVAAVDPDIAEEALALIDVDYEDLPAVFDPVEAIRDGAPILHENPGAYDGAPSERPHPNVQSVLRFKLGDVEAGFGQADRIFEHTFRTQLDHQGYLEPHAGVVAIDDGRVQVWASNKMPFRLKELLSHALQLAPEQIRVNLTPIGGDFGGKGSLMDLPLAYHLARVTGRPVKMLMRYAEELMAGNPRHPSVITMRTGVTKDGRILARRVKALFNSGAYAAFKPAPSVNLGGTGMGAGVYRIPNLLIEALCVYSNNIPCGHARSPGEPQMVFAGESHMDMIARELAIDPADLRRKNLLRDGDHLANGHHLEHVRASDTLEAALKASHWAEPKAGPWIGRGMAMTHRHIGVGFTNARLRLDSSGTVILSIALPDTGTGAHLVLRQVVAEVLGLPLDQVEIEVANTDDFETDSGVGGSRVTHTGGRAAYHAAEKLKAQIEAEAAKHGIPAGSLAALARAAAQDGRTLEAAHFYDAKAHAAVTSFTAQVAEVAVDPATGQVTVRHFTTAHDVGTIINPIGHQGQIEGGFVQGLGFALMEEMKTEDGRISTLSLGDFKLPTIQDIPPLTTVILQDPVGPGPFNAKAIGEGSISAVAPAVANAVADACGVRILDLPITAEKVFFALREKVAR